MDKDKATKILQIAKFMGPTWGPPQSCRPQMGSILAPWTLLSGTHYTTNEIALFLKASDFQNNWVWYIRSLSFSFSICFVKKYTKFSKITFSHEKSSREFVNAVQLHPRNWKVYSNSFSPMWNWFKYVGDCSVKCELSIVPYGKTHINDNFIQMCC